MKREFIKLCRTDFLAFASKAIRELDGTRITNDPYLEFLAGKAIEFANGDCQKLYINLPPRHLKTQLFSVCLPAWILGHNPMTKIMILACSKELAEEIARKIRSIMQSSWFGEVFETRVAKGQAKAMNFSTTVGGGVFAASVYANITGHGAAVIIVDDLHRIPDAGKPQKLARSIERYTYITSRRNNPKKARILVIGHRISENDIFAHLRAKKWESVILPLVAIRDVVYETVYGTWHRRKGELLRPDAFDQDEIEDLRKSNINPDFQMLYQQDCDGQARLPITRAHFRIGALPDCANLHRVLSIEPGVDDRHDASFSVAEVWAFDEVNYYLIDEFRDQCDFGELKKKVRALRKRHLPDVVLIENTTNGPALISDLKRKWKDCQEIVPITPRGSKASRFYRHIEKICDGHVWLREHGAFCEEFIDELVAFPHGDYTDQVDAFTQAADWIDQNRHLAKHPRKVARQLPMVVATGRHSGIDSFNPGPSKPDAPGLCVVRGNSSASWWRRR